MKKIVLAALFSTLAATAYAQSPSCESQAEAKNLHGAAQTSFITKCKKDAEANTAQTTCDTQAADKKLAGAAKASFTKKCVSDTLGI